MKFLKLAISSAAAAAVMFTGCGDDAATTASTTSTSNVGAISCVTTSITYNGTAYTEICTISGQFKDQTVDLNASVLNRIDGEVLIGGDNANSSTLNIAAGSVLFASGADFLAVSRGSTINANGTLANPIIMTSADDINGDANETSAGQWGGLVLAGNGQINTGTEEAFEFSTSGLLYGGQDDTDNSGSITYTIIKYSGFTFPTGDGIEVQGLSMGGIGSGTTLSNIQVYNSSDDGIEIWGGAPKFDHVVITGAQDDSIDTDHGARPTFQYVYVEQSSSSDHVLEADNDGSNYSSIPQSHPVISNFTFVSGNKDAAFRWKEGTAYSLYNGAATDINGSYTTIAFDTDETIDNMVAGGSEVIGVDLFDAAAGQTTLAKAGTLTASKLTSFVDNNISNSDINGTATVTAIDPSTKDASFDAISDSDYEDLTDNDWRIGWALDANGSVHQ
jgi:hypothetical protein